MLLIKSILVGICAVMPGVSGSIIMISFGLYDRLINIISNHRIKENIFFLITLILGIIIGIYLASFSLIYLLHLKEILFYIFIGIISSEIPFIIKKINDRGKFRFIPFLLSFIISLLLDLINKKNYISNYSFFRYFIGGILFSFGKVFPGVSSSFFLLCLGIYDKIIILILNPFLIFKSFLIYFPFLLGSIIGLIIFAKLIGYLMNNYYELVYSIILGIIISSIVILFPNFTFDVKNIIGFTLMIIIFLLFINNKHKNI